MEVEDYTTKMVLGGAVDGNDLFSMVADNTKLFNMFVLGSSFRWGPCCHSPCLPLQRHLE